MRGLLLALLLVATAASAQTTDLAAIVQEQCGNEGWRRESSCEVVLPRGVLEIGETVLGECQEPQQHRSGLTIRGQGVGGFATVPPFSTAGTTLKYVGPDGGTMLSSCGNWFQLRDLSIYGTGAGVVLRRTANNAKGDLSHMGIIERIAIQGGGIGVQYEGEGTNDQHDFQVLRDAVIRGVEVCLEQDNQQAALNHVENVDCASTKAGYVVRNGGMNFERAYVGQLRLPDGTYDQGFVAYWLTHSLRGPSYMTPHDVAIINPHLEIHAGTWFKDTSLSQFAVRVQGGKAHILVPPEGPPSGYVMTLFDVATRGGWTVDGLTVTAGAGKSPKGLLCTRGPNNLIVRDLVVTSNVGRVEWRCPSP